MTKSKKRCFFLVSRQVKSARQDARLRHTVPDPEVPDPEVAGIISRAGGDDGAFALRPVTVRAWSHLACALAQVVHRVLTIVNAYPTGHFSA